MTELNELLNDIIDTVAAGECREGDAGGWPYHAHHVIGGSEVQFYRGSGNRDRGDAGDIMARWDSWTEKWTVTL